MPLDNSAPHFHNGRSWKSLPKKKNKKEKEEEEVPSSRWPSRWPRGRAARRVAQALQLSFAAAAAAYPDRL